MTKQSDVQTKADVYSILSTERFAGGSAIYLTLNVSTPEDGI